MAFNKFMHPRNRYKDNKPNFDELAEKYPDFARHVIRNQAGKATLDFHDSESLRSLTCTLLKEDFGLEVELPLDRLIPTLSLRLNYIHWIEDLLASTGHSQETVWAIDIGCGASCIYPLLGAQMNGWNFLASEVDALAINYANENIKRNGLAQKITVVESVEDEMFERVLNSAPSRQPLYHFTMCNPPFFGNSLEAQGIMASRSMSRPEPKSVSTAAELEMIAEGGEVEFVRRMIEESLHLRDQVVWYTSMLGKKSSLALVREELRNHKIRNVTYTEFCQGRTMRWGIAWTFKEDIQTPLPACKRRKLSEKTTPFTLSVPDTYIKRVLEPGMGGGLQNKIQAVGKAVHHMMKRLEMSVDRKPSSKWCVKFILTATRNTWSHQRRKRRRERRMKSLLSPSTSQAQASTSASSASEDDVGIQKEASDLPVAVPSHASDPRASTTAISSDGTVMKRARLDTSPQEYPGRSTASCSSSDPRASTTATSSDGTVLKRTCIDTFPQEDPGRSTASCSLETLPDAAPAHISSIPKASLESVLDSIHKSHEDIPTTSSHAISPAKLESPASSPRKRVRENVASQECSETIGMTDGIRYIAQSSSDEAEDSFPLDIQFDIKLGDRRTIILVATVEDPTKKSLLHQVVQYIKNQMK